MNMCDMYHRFCRCTDEVAPAQNKRTRHCAAPGAEWSCDLLPHSRKAQAKCGRVLKPLHCDGGRHRAYVPMLVGFRALLDAQREGNVGGDLVCSQGVQRTGYESCSALMVAQHGPVASGLQT